MVLGFIGEQARESKRERYIEIERGWEGEDERARKRKRERTRGSAWILLLEPGGNPPDPPL